jgi:pimeloyl-ACP methyl ester carboxylesterase
MGEHDSMFLPGIKSLIKKHKRSSLVVLKNSGHVVNIDAAEAFNQASIAFIKKNESVKL